MGGIFALSRKSLPDIFIDLQNAAPKSAEEEEIYNDFVSSVYEPSASIFSRFSNYHDGQGLAAEALTNPTPELKEAAWDAIYQNVLLQMEVFQFAKTVTEKFESLIRMMLKFSDGSCDIFANYPAITKCFADCFDIILKFDEIKLTLPKLINDLAFFRRSASAHSTDGQLDELIGNTNSSTLFWAASSPMLNDVVTSLQSKFTAGTEELTRLLSLLGGVSDVCTSIGTKVDDEKAQILCLRCIVCATLIIDHLGPEGAFSQKSLFHVREGMEFLINFNPQQSTLINAIKFSSKHLNDPESDPKVKNMFP